VSRVTRDRGLQILEVSGNVAGDKEVIEMITMTGVGVVLLIVALGALGAMAQKDGSDQR
jgi:hypothetical protein